MLLLLCLSSFLFSLLTLMLLHHFSLSLFPFLLALFFVLQSHHLSSISLPLHLLFNGYDSPPHHLLQSSPFISPPHPMDLIGFCQLGNILTVPFNLFQRVMSTCPTFLVVLHLHLPIWYSIFFI